MSRGAMSNNGGSAMSGWWGQGQCQEQQLVQAGGAELARAVVRTGVEGE